MKGFVYWFLGKRAGQVVVGTWNWLWGIPVESGGRIALSVAEESLQSMQKATQRLAEAIAIQDAAYKRAKQKYEEKLAQLSLLERQVQTSLKMGNENAARLGMSQIVQIEQALPGLKSMVDEASHAVEQGKEKLQRERIRLESRKTDMQNMRDLSEVNQALEAISKVNQEFDINSAQNQFETAKNALDRRHLKQKAMVEFSENPMEKLNAELNQMDLDAEVNRRLIELSMQAGIEEN